MEKKNTILLTVIAVATLLVAVVGATFAYYSITVNNNFTNTTINATANAVDVVTLDESALTLDLVITPADMSKNNENASYFAIKTGTENAGASVGGKYATSNQSYPFARAELTTKQIVTYECKGKATITVAGEMLEHLERGDAILLLTAGEHAVIEEAEEVNNLDLSSFKGQESKPKEFTYKYTLPVKSSEESGTTVYGDLKVDMKITNTENDQTSLAGKKLTVTVEPGTPKCEIKASAGD